jgi:hypothetical protein
MAGGALALGARRAGSANSKSTCHDQSHQTINQLLNEPITINLQHISDVAIINMIPPMRKLPTSHHLGIIIVGSQ